MPPAQPHSQPQATRLAGASRHGTASRPVHDREPPDPQPQTATGTQAARSADTGRRRPQATPSAAASRHGTASHPAHGRKPPQKRKPPPLDAVRVATGMQAAPAGTAQTAPVPKPRTCRARLLCVERAFYGNEMQRLPFMAMRLPFVAAETSFATGRASVPQTVKDVHQGLSPPCRRPVPSRKERTGGVP